MKKVLITGGAGFIAHHLIYHILKTTNWEIVSLDRLDYSGNLNRLHNVLSSTLRFTKSISYTRGTSTAVIVSPSDAV